ncbi:hypothetical protein VE00_06389 [Pseudogymnoascus sp. WSF 3629]|nr:hypothetical protein VE00_06389 [Pseudogymnoascus sp. WSF 3629]
MSAVNLIPLLCGPRLALASEMLGISLRTHFGIHKWIGRTAIAEALLHIIISVISEQPFAWTAMKLSGVIGGSSLGLLFVFSLHLLRDIMYEWFPRSHLILTAVVLVALWFHLPSKKLVARSFFLAGVILWTVVTMLHLVYFTFRNIASGRILAKARVMGLPGAMKVAVNVARPWHVKAGQYIFLSIPAAELTSVLQSHPFLIVWWERNMDGLTIFLLVDPTRRFANKLDSLQNKKLVSLIDGPYGLEHNFGEYGTVLMFATGLGIAGHMLYIRELVSGYNSCDVSTRRIVLIWQVDDRAHLQWVKQWMDAVIEMDTGYILNMHLYVPWMLDDVDSDEEIEKPALGKPRVKNYGEHEMLDKHSGTPDITEIVKAQIKGKMGRMIVSVCSSNIMTDQVRREVQGNVSAGVRFVELDYQPPPLNTNVELDMDFSCKGMP